MITKFEVGKRYRWLQLSGQYLKNNEIYTCISTSFNGEGGNFKECPGNTWYVGSNFELVEEVKGLSTIRTQGLEAYIKSIEISSKKERKKLMYSCSNYTLYLQGGLSACQDILKFLQNLK